MSQATLRCFYYSLRQYSPKNEALNGTTMTIRGNYYIYPQTNPQEIISTLKKWDRQAQKFSQHLSLEKKPQMQTCSEICDAFAQHLEEKDSISTSKETLWICRDNKGKKRSIMIFSDAVFYHPDYLEIIFLVTNPKTIHRRLTSSNYQKGAGSALVQTLINHCAHQDKKGIVVIPSNTSSQFYEQLGFEHEPGQAYLMILTTKKIQEAHLFLAA